MIQARRYSYYGAAGSSALLLLALIALQFGHLSYGGDEIDTGIDVGLRVEVPFKVPETLDSLDGDFSCPANGCRSPSAPIPATAEREALISAAKDQKGSSCQAGDGAVCDHASKGSADVAVGVARKQASADMRIVMEPSYLDWGESPICSMKTSTVEVRYNGAEGSAPLRVTSLSTDEIQFYPLAFKAVEVPLGGSTTLEVVYLPRTIGPVDATLVVQTSQGAFLLHMHGHGIMSPYGVTPLSGPKVPFGLQYSYVLMVRNPLKTRLVIREIYTHESFLRLSLLPQHRSDIKDTEGPSAAWVLEPFEEKGVIMLEFKSSVPGKFSGMVTVLTDDVTLMIPVDILAIRGGVHASLEEVDFGTLTFPEEHHRIPVTLLNIGPGAVEVLDVVSSSADPLLGIQYKKGVVLEAGSERTVASVSYTGAAQGRFSGKLFFITNETSHEPPAQFSSPKGVAGAHGNRVELPYKARVLHGSLRYRAENSTFEARKGRSVLRELVLTNHFTVPVVIYSATLADPSSFAVESFPTGHVLAPSGGVAPPLQLRFTANSSDLSFSTQMLVSSNVSMLSIPLHVYHGRLHYSVPAPSGRTAAAKSSDSSRDKDRSLNALDFGVLGVNEARTRSFNISNPNPIGIDISSITTSLEETNLRLDYVLGPMGTQVQLGTNEHLLTGGTGGKAAGQTGGGGGAGGLLGSLLQGLQGLDTKAKGGKKGRQVESNSVADVAANNGNEAVSHVVHEPVVVEGGAGTGGIGLDLGPGHTAVFTVELTAEEEERGVGEVVVVTPKERHSIPLLYESIHGSLSIAPAIVRFEGCFPGLIRSAPLMARSAYSRPLTVTAVTTSDPRVRLIFSNTTIPPGNKRVLLGTVEFDASISPPPMPSSSSSSSAAAAGGGGGKKASSSSSSSTTSDRASAAAFAPDDFDAAAAHAAALSGHLSKADLAMLKARTDAWDSLVQEADGEVRASVTIHTDLVAGYTLSVRAGLSKPTILAAPMLNYSIIEVGTAALGVVQVVNPSAVPLAAALIEPVLAPEAAEPQPAPRLLGSGFGPTRGSTLLGGSPQYLDPHKVSPMPCLWCSAEAVRRGPETQEPACAQKPRPCRLVDDPSQPQERPPFRLPPGAIKDGVVPPGGSLTLGPVEFSPLSHARPAKAVLHVRNNLTSIEQLLLEGRGGSGTLHFLLDHDEPDGMLRFKIDPALIGLHQKRTLWHRSGTLSTRRELTWPVRVQKRFTAVNLGNMATRIHSVWLVPIRATSVYGMPGDGSPIQMQRECNAGGFSLLDCGVLGRTEVPAGGSTEFWVQYSPELSRPFSQCLLLIETSIGKQHFFLHSSMPLEALKAVHSTLAFAPEWKTARYSAALIVLALTLGSIGTVYSEIHDEMSPDVSSDAAPPEHGASNPLQGLAPLSALKSRDQQPGPGKPARHEAPSEPPDKQAEQRNVPRLHKQTSAASDSSCSTVAAGDTSDSASALSKDDAKGSRKKRRNTKPQAEEASSHQALHPVPGAPREAEKPYETDTPALMPVTPETHPGQSDDDTALIGEAVPGRRQQLEHEQRRQREVRVSKDSAEAEDPQDAHQDTRAAAVASGPSKDVKDLEVSVPAGNKDEAAPSTPMSNTHRSPTPKSNESLSLTGSTPSSPSGEGSLTAAAGEDYEGADDRTYAEEKPTRRSVDFLGDPEKTEDQSETKGSSSSAPVESSKAPSEQQPPPAEAPGSKRMAHAKLLTPLQTSQNSYLGDITPATGKPPQPTPTQQQQQRPLEEPSPASADPAATPKSARRRRRPRRGGGGNSNPPTPGAGLQAETPTAETPSTAAAATPTPTAASTAAAASAAAAAAAAPLPLTSDRRTSRRQSHGEGTAAPVSMWSQPPSAAASPSPLLPPSPGLPPAAPGPRQQQQQPQHPLLPPSAAFQQPPQQRQQGPSAPHSRPRGIPLDQLGASTRIPDSVYSIWGAGGSGMGGPSGSYDLELPGSLIGDPMPQEPTMPLSGLQGAPVSSVSNMGGFQDPYDYAPEFSGSLFSSFPTSSQPFGRPLQPPPQQQTMTMPLHDLLGDDLMADSGLFAPPSDGGSSGSAFGGFSLFSPFLGGRNPAPRPPVEQQSNPFMGSDDFRAIWAGGPTDPSDPLHWPMEGLSSSHEEEQQLPIPEEEQRMWANLD